MKKQSVKAILPVLLALVLLSAGAALATGHGEVVPDDNAAVNGIEAAHEANVAAEEMKEGHMAEAAAEAHAAAVHSEAVEAGAHAAGVEGEGHGGEHHAPMITPAKLKDLFWRTANFLALVVILVKFLAKPIASGLSGRRRQIQEELEELQAKRDEAERSYKEFEARLAGMEKEMEVIVEKAVAQAEAEKARILEEAERAAEDIKRQAEAAVQAELVDARRMLRDEVAEQAAAMAEELIVKNLTPEDQIAITEQYLERVGAVQ